MAHRKRKKTEKRAANQSLDRALALDAWAARTRPGIECQRQSTRRWVYMMEGHKERPNASSRKRGCLITIVIVSGVIVWALWQIGEPSRRAERVHHAISPGVAFGDVEYLLTGRHYCFFQVKTNKQWQLFLALNSPI